MVPGGKRLQVLCVPGVGYSRGGKGFFVNGSSNHSSHVALQRGPRGKRDGLCSNLAGLGRYLPPRRRLGQTDHWPNWETTRGKICDVLSSTHHRHRQQPPRDVCSPAQDGQIAQDNALV